MKTRFEHAYVLNVMSDDHPGNMAAQRRVAMPPGHSAARLGGRVLERNRDARMLRTDEILSTIQMLRAEHLDVRTVTDIRNAGTSGAFVRFGGRISAPIQSLRN